MTQAEKLYEDANELMNNDDFSSARNVSKKIFLFKKRILFERTFLFNPTTNLFKKALYTSHSYV